MEENEKVNNVTPTSRRQPTMEKILDELETIKYAFIGNELTRDGGLIRRVERSETELEVLEKRIIEMENDRDIS